MEASAPKRPGDAPDGAAEKRMRPEGDGAGSSPVATALEEQVSAVCGEIKQWAKDPQIVEGIGEAVAPLVQALRKLTDMSIDIGVLRRTGVGREVNHRWIRDHPDAAVKEASAALVHKWKAASAASADGAAQSAAQRTTKAATSDPASAKASSPPHRAPSAQSPPLRASASPPHRAGAATSPAAAATPNSGSGSTAGATPKPDGKQKTDKKEKKEKKEKKDGEKDKDKKEKKEKTAKKDVASASDVACPNQALADMFKELAGFEYKQKKHFHGHAYTKVNKAIAGLDFQIVSILQVKGLPGVGKASTAKILEFLDTGKIERLERYRRGDFSTGGGDE